LGINGKSLEPYYTVPKIIGHHKNPKTFKTFKHEEFSGCPIFLRAAMQKIQHFYNLPGQNKNFQKCPKFFKHPGRIQNTLDYCLGGPLFQ
jgi:hypothetical protein